MELPRLPEAPRVVVRACARRITGEQFNLPAPPVGKRPAKENRSCSGRDDERQQDLFHTVRRTR